MHGVGLDADVRDVVRAAAPASGRGARGSVAGGARAVPATTVPPRPDRALSRLSATRADRAQQAVRRDLQVQPGARRGARSPISSRCRTSIPRAGSTPTARACCCSPTTARCRRASPNPRHKLAKVYWAQVEGVPTEDALDSAARGRRPRRLRHAARGRAAHRRARGSLAARSADPLSREDPDRVGRAHAARRQEPAGAPHDRAASASRRCGWCARASATSGSTVWRRASGARSTRPRRGASRSAARPRPGGTNRRGRR